MAEARYATTLISLFEHDIILATCHNHLESCMVCPWNMLNICRQTNIFSPSLSRNTWKNTWTNALVLQVKWTSFITEIPIMSLMIMSKMCDDAVQMGTIGTIVKLIICKMHSGRKSPA